MQRCRREKFKNADLSGAALQRCTVKGKEYVLHELGGGVVFCSLGVESSDLNATLDYLESNTFSQKQTQKYKILSTAQAIQN